MTRAAGLTGLRSLPGLPAGVRGRADGRPGWRWRCLAIGLIAGYLVGHEQARPSALFRPTAAPAVSAASSAAPGVATPRPTVTITVPDLTATGNRCAVQDGTTLQLGIEVANQSSRTVAVSRFQAVLPIGGLRATTESVGTCGALASGAPTSVMLPAGATEWLTITFRVLVRCPGPYPVQFQVSYIDSGTLTTTQLDEFPDLGQVTYSGCGSA